VSAANVSPKIVGFYVNWDDNSLVSLKANINHLDVLIPEWLHVRDEKGGLLFDDQKREKETLTFIQNTRPDLPIYPLINNYDPRTQKWEGAKLAKLLANPVSREKLIHNLLQYVEENKYGGISIDFESIPDQSQYALILFMRELSLKFHERNLVVSQNIPLEDNSFNARTYGAISDFLLLMAYDEHVPGEASGPLASIRWYATALSQRFSELSPEKYVIVLGGYGYDWSDKAEDASLTFEQAMARAESTQSQPTYDMNAMNLTYSYMDEKQVKHTVWILDAVAAFNEMVATRYLGNPFGFGLWRLGSEDPSIWNIFAEPEKLDQAAADQLKNLSYGYDVIYEGRGEILQIARSSREGNRTLVYDATSGFITDEDLTVLPSPYVLNRRGGEQKKRIALTFDDGPHPEYTPRILEILRKYDVRATFFVVGANASIHPEILKDIFKQGSEIGNHTYTHPNIASLSPKQFQFELDSMERVIEAILGRKSVLFRPPYAEDVEPAVPEEALNLEFTHRLGYYTVGMRIDSNDWRESKEERIVSNVLEQAENGDGNIVLMHDGGGNREQTVASLPKIIEGLRSAGFEIVPVSKLMSLPRASVMPPVTPGERFTSTVNGLTFHAVGLFYAFIRAMFWTGIVLGLSRFMFLGILAFSETVKSRLNRKKKERIETSFHPSVAVVIPAYNEEKVITRTIQSILNSDYAISKVIVVDDGSKDGTLSSLRTNFKDHSKVHILTKSRSGKAHALNFGLEEIEEEIIVTLDADTLFRFDTIRKLVRNFSNPKVGGVAGNTKVGNRINVLTKWQALEYVISQNLDRRALGVLNSITVVPGAVGAWRKKAILDAGGFSDETLAEDADLTWSILRRGYSVVYEEEAIAFTEAPEKVSNFLTQRFRWMYGTLQTAWKHSSCVLSGPLRIGWIAIPNVLIFQIFFSLISPLMDFFLILTLLWSGWQKWHHPLGFSLTENLQELIIYYFLFLIADFLLALIPFLWEHDEKFSLLIWLPLQRFFYRQLLYYVAVKTIFKAIKGSLAHWGKFERRASLDVFPLTKPEEN